jgi:hypothetical protein
LIVWAGDLHIILLLQLNDAQSNVGASMDAG